jgi:hypothetical protein
MGAAYVTYFGYECRQWCENILVVHLCANLVSTVDAQISIIKIKKNVAE